MYIFFEFLRRIGGTMVRHGCLKYGRSWAEALVRSDQIKDYTINLLSLGVPIDNVVRFILDSYVCIPKCTE
jgi:hypothetical protein